ncbi:DegT/DnrJ/EryC1/StrS family aminotransferase, partial [Bacillus altitudinis]|uniref:DegT/DnrJ/EryC1/StrS family aminotransferase n=1 Tax=Bacillus altitudinis TaxID=293387 RepID=UPI0011A2F670
KFKQFQKYFNNLTSANHPIPLNSCTPPLFLPLNPTRIPPPHHLITTPLTFSPTPNTIIHTRPPPIFLHIHPATLNLHAKKLQAAITPHTKPVLPLHFPAQSSHIHQILPIPKNYHFFLLHHPAHPLYTTYHHQP